MHLTIHMDSILTIVFGRAAALYDLLFSHLFLIAFFDLDGLLCLGPIVY